MVGDTLAENNQTKFPASAQDLNTDVLVEIFLRCSLGENEDQDAFDINLPKPSIHSSPLILGRVCRAWRHVSLSTPQLWSYLCIPESWNSPEGMAEWLKRSASSPLTFGLFDKRHDDLLYRVDALNVLLASAHRWKHVEVRADIELISLFLHSVESGAPLLETFRIRDYHNWTDDEDFLDCVELDLSIYPRLKSLHLPESVRVVLHHRNIVLDNLRNIWLGFLTVDGRGVISMDEYLTLLALCPNLEDASFAITGSSPLQRMGDVIERNIRKLCIFVPLGLNIGPFFDYIRLPHLVDLEISDMTDETPRKFPWSHIMSFLRRSKASLIRLDLSWRFPANILSDDDLLGILHLTPDIQQLFLHRLPVSDVLLQTFSQPSNHGKTSSCLWPKLVDISVVGGTFSEAAVKDMILSPHRFEGAKSFEQLFLNDCGLKYAILFADEEIQKCIENGLSLEIEGYNHERFLRPPVRVPHYFPTIRIPDY
ncbi:hypothetical protein BD410DRAFT_785080 [Rickenella mellea]|uniref:F-box domain-containing protein n=1 Tax=Rickenella mellea TaxID=50990 RepID=A0A4Y7QEB8_9AGAM|nr:hypothetical protein BD410DRAFT_785080 [Rickenella mellea]